jgi:ferric-dicitrate binding protein FerR (iron transport regulator)
MNKQQLRRLIHNELTNEERLAVLQWIKKDEEHQRLYNQIKAQQVARTLGKANKEHHQLSYKHLIYRISKIHVARFAYRAAGVAALIGLGYFFVFTPYTNSLNELKQSSTQVTRAENIYNKKIHLPDGSLVSLNVDSHLEYSKEFGQHTREVTLVGEGFFDVVHDPEKPFIVKTRDFDIRVLGTSFDVKSYENDLQTETTLLSGKVELFRENETPIVLTPSQKAIFFSEEKKLVIEEAITDDVVAWRHGKLVFKDVSMLQVAHDLERKYDAKIHILSPELLNYKFTGTFDNLSLDESLHLLTLSSPIEFNKTNNQITLNFKE